MRKIQPLSKMIFSYVYSFLANEPVEFKYRLSALNLVLDYKGVTQCKLYLCQHTIITVRKKQLSKSTRHHFCHQMQRVEPAASSAMLYGKTTGLLEEGCCSALASAFIIGITLVLMEAYGQCNTYLEIPGNTLKILEI